MSINIAYIEDNQDDFDFVNAIASRDKEANLSFRQFKNLSEFNLKMNESEFDMILLDLVLPDSSIPRETIEKVIGKTSLPIVVLSSSVTEGRKYLEKYPELANFLEKAQLKPSNLVNTLQGLHGFRSKMEANVDTKLKEYKKTEYDRFLRLNRNLAHNLNNQLCSLVGILDSLSIDDFRVDEALDRINGICSQFVEISSMEISSSESLAGSSFLTLLRGNINDIEISNSFEEKLKTQNVIIDPLSMQNILTAIFSYYGNEENASNLLANLSEANDGKLHLVISKLKKVDTIINGEYDVRSLRPGYVSYSVVERLCELKNVSLKHHFSDNREILELCFEIQPLKEAQNRAVDVSELSPVEVNLFDPMLKQVLLMEDNDVLREVMVDNLKRSGYKVLPAIDGQQGLEIYEKCKDNIGLVISDVVMPRLNGVDAVNTILKDRNDMPVIFLTGTHLDRGDLKHCSDKCFHVLNKPVKTKKLIEIIKNFEKEEI